MTLGLVLVACGQSSTNGGPAATPTVVPGPAVAAPPTAPPAPTPAPTPTTVALSGEYAVTANAGDQTLSVIPIGQPAVATTVPLGQSPSDLAAGPNAPVAFAVPMGGSSLLVANLDAQAPVTTLGAGGPIDRVLAPLDNSSGPLLLVSDTDDTIRSLDPNSGALGAPLQLSAGPHVAAVGTDAQGNPQVYVTNAGDGSVEIVDPAATAIQANVEVGGRPVGAVSALNGQLWVADGDAGTVTGIDLSLGQAVDTIQVGPGLTGLSATPDGRYLLASSSDPAHALYSIDLFGAQAGETDGVVRSLEVDSGVSALATGAEVTVAYATTGANQLLYWDIAGNTITHTVPVGQKPVALALSQAAPTGLSPALARVGGGTISTTGSSGATGGSGSGSASGSGSTGSSGTGSSTTGATGSTGTGSTGASGATGAGANGTSGSGGSGTAGASGAGSGSSTTNSGAGSTGAAGTGAAGSTTDGSGATSGAGAVSSGASTTSGGGTTGASSGAQPAAAGVGSASNSTSSSSIASGGSGGGGSAGAASIQCSGCSAGGGGAAGGGAPGASGGASTISSGGGTSSGNGANPSGASGSSSISSGGSTISSGGSSGNGASGISSGGSTGISSGGSSGAAAAATGIGSGGSSGGSGVSSGIRRRLRRQRWRRRLHWQRHQRRHWRSQRGRRHQRQRQQQLLGLLQ